MILYLDKDINMHQHYDVFGSPNNHQNQPAVHPRKWRSSSRGAASVWCALTTDAPRASVLRTVELAGNIWNLWMNNAQQKAVT